MNFAKVAFDNKVTTLVLTFCALGGGLLAYQGLSRLEDPEFTIKDALVITPYPGASAEEVEEEVSDRLEIAVQQMGQLDEVTSKSDRGLSTLTVSIKKNYTSADLPQVWDELRRKINDAQRNLPPGAGPSMVVDDFGDVYGVFVAIYGEGYSYAELMDFVKLLRRELLLVQDVAKVAIYASRTEAVYVELDRDRMSQLGIPTSAIINELRLKNIVTNSGRVKVGTEYIAIEPSGAFTSVEEFGSLLIRGGPGGRQVRLRDVATVRRGYVEPANPRLRFDGHTAIGLGISTASGGNVVTMGAALRVRVQELVDQTPLGIEFGVIALQSEAVATAISGFVVSLLQAVAIVVVVLLFFMGVRSAALIGFILVLTIAATFMVMSPMGIALERISLGALIIALGMLVDNAIVVVDGMLVKIQQGEDPRKAGEDVVNQTAIPLFGATFVAILGFAAIGTSDDSTGEFCRSLFQVVFISLNLSWLTAVTVTPLLGAMFLKPSAKQQDAGDAYSGRFYSMYRGVLATCISRRWATMGVVAALFVTSLWGFRFVDQSFFPSGTRPQFMIDYWMPQGTHIDDTEARVAEIEEYVMQLEGVTHVSSFVGQGGLRFLLTYSPEKLNSAYAQFVVEVDDYREIDGLTQEVERYLETNHVHALGYTQTFQLGPGGAGLLQVRFSGPQPDVLRSLSGQAQTIMHEDGNIKGIRTDWRQRVKIVRPLIIDEVANLNGITRPDIAAVLQTGFQGARVGVYRERDDLLPIIVRAPEVERSDVSSARNLQIWSPAAGRMIPLRQVVSGFETAFEDEIIWRKDRTRTLTVFADPRTGRASAALARIMPQIEAIELAPGYTMEWGGEYENSREAQAGLAASLPMFLVAMILIVIALFNSLRQALIIWLTVPLALIGVTGGLLLTNNPFGFMSLLGVLSLIGMLVKNAIVLIDQINLEIGEGKQVYQAILDSGVSRLRPVGMAAATTALGLIPLLADAFFVAMAVTIIAGLLFATILTMIVVPVLYAIMYKVTSEPAPVG